MILAGVCIWQHRKRHSGTISAHFSNCSMTARRRLLMCFTRAVVSLWLSGHVQRSMHRLVVFHVFIHSIQSYIHTSRDSCSIGDVDKRNIVSNAEDSFTNRRILVCRVVTMAATGRCSAGFHDTGRSTGGAAPSYSLHLFTSPYSHFDLFRPSCQNA